MPEKASLTWRRETRFWGLDMAAAMGMVDDPSHLRGLIWVKLAERQFNSRNPGRGGSFPGSTLWASRLVRGSRSSIGMVACTPALEKAQLLAGNGDSVHGGGQPRYIALSCHHGNPGSHGREVLISLKG